MENIRASSPRGIWSISFVASSMERCKLGACMIFPRGLTLVRNICHNLKMLSVLGCKLVVCVGEGVIPRTKSAPYSGGVASSSSVSLSGIASLLCCNYNGDKYMAIPTGQKLTSSDTVTHNLLSDFSLGQKHPRLRHLLFNEAGSALVDDQLPF